MKEQLQHTCGEPLQVRKLIFRDLQRQLHPDKNTHCEEAAKHAFQKLMEERWGTQHHKLWSLGLEAWHEASFTLYNMVIQNMRHRLV
eukprot:g11259.t1